MLELLAEGAELLGHLGVAGVEAVVDGGGAQLELPVVRDQPVVETCTRRGQDAVDQPAVLVAELTDDVGQVDRGLTRRADGAGRDDARGDDGGGGHEDDDDEEQDHAAMMGGGSDSEVDGAGDSEARSEPVGPVHRIVDVPPDRAAQALRCSTGTMSTWRLPGVGVRYGAKFVG